MHFLFVKTHLAWPRSSGHDVHCYGMMQALSQLGHQVSLLTRAPCSQEALAGIELHAVRQLEAKTLQPNLKLKWLEKRYCSFWGVDQADIAQTGALARELGADVVVAVGLDILPYLADVNSAQRVWYAADEWVLHHLSQFTWRDRASWPNLRAGLIKGVYERAFASRVDRVWVVSRADARAVKWVMGRPAVDIVVNGVDATHFAPVRNAEVSNSCVFWGRLDFGPNIDALRWFASQVWPAVKVQRADAVFAVFGFQPVDEVIELCKQNNFLLQANMPDIRSSISGYQVVVLPFVSGAGVKNKMLEAAAMERPILGSPTAFNGVELYGQEPCWIAKTPSQWQGKLIALWDSPHTRAQLGACARRWVTGHYTWEAAAVHALAALDV